MVRFTARSFMHLLPEEVEGEFQHPFYAKVVKINGNDVSFTGLEGGQGLVSREVAERCVVSAAEVNRHERQSLLRRGVSALVDGRFHHGQVTQLKEGSITIESAGEELVVAPANAKVIDPVVALLLSHTVFESQEWDQDEIDQIHADIIGRVLGRNGIAPSRRISTILDGILDESNQPSPNIQREWVDPATGEMTNFPLQHAVDFAYFVDGNVSPVPSSVGHDHPNEEEALFDPFEDDDNTPDAAVENESPAYPTARRQGSNTRPNSATNRTHLVRSEPTGIASQAHAVETDAMILDKLSDDPLLLDRFLALRRRARSLEQSSPAPSYVKSPRVGDKRTSERKSKYSFDPTSEQRAVHIEITSEKYQGKEPTVFVNHLITSTLVTFKPVPGVLTRLYSFEFGTKGLSIMHFAPFRQAEKVAWHRSGGANFNNLSVTAEFSPAKAPSCITEVADAARVLTIYTREFCSQTVVDLVDSLLACIQHLSVTYKWANEDLPDLIFWADGILQEFSTSVTGVNIGGDPNRVKERCSTKDDQLRDLLYEIQSRRIDRAAPNPQPRVSPRVRLDRQGGHRSNRTHANQGRGSLGPIPKRVIQLLPTRLDPKTGTPLRLCLRYISNDGCASQSDTDCHRPGCAHFVPESIDGLVKAEILKRFSGLKPQYGHL